MAKEIKLTEKEFIRAMELVSNPADLREYRRGLVGVLLADNRYSAAELGVRMGITERTVLNDLAKIRNPDIQSSTQLGGTRNFLMTFEDEEAFLGEYLEMAKEGIIITMPKLHDEINIIIGKITPKSTFYRLLERHNWRKVKPDTVHLHSDPKIQEEFKKNT
ncbi:MAG: winged helix-turn-helix domain-containing protein [Deltaproteobacteria bacterium]|jgi:hypothetical protein|nr:winged helix-turn-helix domain-containing protein [Deltaproteobacteria bacterium]